MVTTSKQKPAGASLREQSASGAAPRPKEEASLLDGTADYVDCIRQNLVALIEAKGVTQTHIAQVTGIDRTALCKMLKGDRWISVIKLALITRALGANVVDIVPRNSGGQPDPYARALEVALRGLNERLDAGPKEGFDWASAFEQARAIVCSHMEKRGISEADLARTTGIGQSVLSRALSGKRSFSLPQLAAIAPALGVTIGDVLPTLAAAASADTADGAAASDFLKALSLAAEIPRRALPPRLPGTTRAQDSLRGYLEPDSRRRDLTLGEFDMLMAVAGLHGEDAELDEAYWDGLVAALRNTPDRRAK